MSESSLNKIADSFPGFMLSACACQQIFWIIYLLRDTRHSLHSLQQHCPFHLKQEEESAVFWAMGMTAYLKKEKEEEKKEHQAEELIMNDAT